MFGPYSGTRKQSTLHNIEGGGGWEGNQPEFVLFTLGPFTPIPHHPFTRCIYAISFRRVQKCIPLFGAPGDEPNPSEEG